MRAVLLLAAAAFLHAPGSHAAGRAPSDDAAERCRTAAADTRIVRDEWGIAHVHGKSDADAVFGMMYAEAEDDFNRIEANYLTALGRVAEAEGEAAIYQDLRARLFIEPDDLRRRYAKSPGWLQRLMVAWADGLNCYLRSHPDTQPRVLRHFEPWMALSFTEGSIGGDIERVPLGPLQAFYGGVKPPRVAELTGPGEPGGSNGIAIAPANTLNHHALLLINPHTSFYFRAELQATSDAGLDVYGAATWGQFFIYQGFNARIGWMHTSSGVDNVDFFRETILRRGGHLVYRYGARLRRVGVSTRVVAYRGADGTLLQRTFTVYRTHHGPIVQQTDGRWVSIALMQKPVEALSQSYLLTKALDYASFMRVMELKANSSNNTVFADADGDIAYLHPQFVPRRDDRIDFRQPVDGADPATDWRGEHALSELPQVLNPPNGWIMNTNDWPYSAAGPYSPRRDAFPRYMDTAGENPRGVHAAMLLAQRRDFSADALNAAAFDAYLPAFAQLVPSLLAAYDALDATAPTKALLSGQITALREWDLRWSAHSVATTLAVLWGDALWDEAKADPDDESLSMYERMREHVAPVRKLALLAAVAGRLEHDFGTWRVPWGRVNRLQRTSDAIVPHFSDAEPSIAVPFTSSRWGSLASFGARRYEGTSRYYGNSGNSFVAIVEFGERVSARAVSVGGESGDPRSMHFDDQSARYADGALRRVYFHPDELAGHIERDYRPE